MHGPDSGNLMIYYNDKIMVIDFKVFKTQSYKFFIDEELCEIIVKKHKKKRTYHYEFKFDTKTQTAYNIRRKKVIKKSNIKGIITMIVVPLLLAAAVFAYIKLREGYLDKQLKQHPKDAWAKVRVIKKGFSDFYETFYHFEKEDGEIISSKLRSMTAPPTTPHGLPLKNGDMFKVKYADGYEFYNNINYNQPDDRTAIEMIKRVAVTHLQHNQGRIHQELLCEVQAAYDIDGMKGLANIYHQKTEAGDNNRHNKDAYLRMTRDTPFQNAFEKCYDEKVWE